MRSPLCLPWRRRRRRADALSEKGLKKAGAVYAIDEDTSITKDMAALAEAKKKLGRTPRGGARSRGTSRRPRASSATPSSRSARSTRTWPSRRTSAVRTARSRSTNALSLKIKEAITYRDQQEKELAKLGDDARSQYITLILQLEKKVTKVEEKYTELAAAAR